MFATKRPDTRLIYISKIISQHLHSGFILNGKIIVFLPLICLGSGFSRIVQMKKNPDDVGNLVTWLIMANFWMT